jgi:hypothetical protein
LKKCRKGTIGQSHFLFSLLFFFSLCAYSYTYVLYTHTHFVYKHTFGLTMPDMSTSSTSGSAPSRHSRHSQRTVPTLVLLSLAVLHSQVYWLYSVIYHLYSNIYDQPQDHSSDGTALSVRSGRSGRARAFSEPQQSTSSVSIAPPQATDFKTSSRKRPRSKYLA